MAENTLTYTITTEWSQMKAALLGVVAEVKATAQGVEQGFKKVQADAAAMSKGVIDETKRMTAQIKADAAVQVSEVRAAAAVQINEAKIQAQGVAQQAKLQAQQVSSAAREQTTSAVNETRAQQAAWAGLMRQKKADLDEQLKAETQWAKASAQATRQLAAEHQQNMNQMAQATQNLSNQMRQSVQTATIASGVAFAGLSSVLKGAATEFASFEGALIRFKAFTGASAATMDAFKEKAMELGKATIYSNTQVAQAGATMVGLGFSAEQATASLASITQVALISGKTLQETATSLGVTIHAFGFAAEEGKNIADVLAFMAKKGTDISGATEAFHYLGAKIQQISPDAVALKNNFESLAGMITVANRAGVQGGQFGQDMAQALTHLLAPTVKGKEAMLKMGLATEDAGGKFHSFAENADGTIKPLSDIVGQIKDATEGMSVMERADYLKKIFAVHALTALNPILQQTKEQLADIEEQSHNTAGTANAVGEDLKKGLAQAFSQLSGSIETAKSSMGESFAPALVYVLGKIQALFDGFSALSPGMKDFITDVVIGTAGVAGLVTVVGGAALVINSVTTATTAVNTQLAILKVLQGEAAVTGTALGVAETAVGTGATAAATGIKGLMLLLGPWALGLAAVSIVLYDIVEAMKLINGNSLAESGLEKASKMQRDARAATAGAGQRLEDKLSQGISGTATETRDAAIDNRLKAADLSNKILANEQTIATLRSGLSDVELRNGNTKIDNLTKQNNALKAQKDLLMGVSVEQAKVSVDLANPEGTVKKFTPVKTQKEIDKEDKKADAEADKAYQVAITKAKTVSEEQIALYRKTAESKTGLSQQQIKQAEQVANAEIAGFDSIGKSVGQCLWGVKQLYAAGKGLQNFTSEGVAQSTLLGGLGSAFEAADRLKKDANYIEVSLDKSKSMASQFKKGDVVVYDRQAGFSAEHGHIEIADPENKRMLSDHARQMEFWKQMEGHTRVFRLKGMSDTKQALSDQTIKDILELQQLEQLKTQQSARLSKPENAKEAASLDKEISDLKRKIGKETAAEQEKQRKEQQAAEDKAAKDLIKMDIAIAKDKLKLGKESIDATLAAIDLESKANTAKNQENMEQAVNQQGLSDATRQALVKKYQELEATEQAGFLKQKEDAIYQHSLKILSIENGLQQHKIDLMADGEEKINAESDFRLKKELESIEAAQHGLATSGDIWKALEEEKTAVLDAELEHRGDLLEKFRSHELELQRAALEERLGRTESGKGTLSMINDGDPMAGADAELSRLSDMQQLLGNITNEYGDIQDKLDNGKESLESQNKLKERQAVLLNQSINLEENINYVKSGQEAIDQTAADARAKAIKDEAVLTAGIKAAAGGVAELAGMFGEAGQAVGGVINKITDMGMGIHKALAAATDGGGFDLSKLFNMENIGDTIGLITKGLSIGVEAARGLAKLFFPDQDALELERKRVLSDILEIDNKIMAIRLENMKKSGQTAAMLFPSKKELLDKQKQAELDAVDLNVEKKKKELQGDTIGNVLMGAIPIAGAIMLANRQKEYDKFIIDSAKMTAKQKQEIEERYAAQSSDLSAEVTKEKTDRALRELADVERVSDQIAKATNAESEARSKSYQNQLAESQRFNSSMAGFEADHSKSKISLMDNEFDRSRANLELERNNQLSALDNLDKSKFSIAEFNALAQKRADIIADTAKKVKELDEVTARELANSLASTKEDTAALLAKAGGNIGEIAGTDKSNFLAKNMREEADAVRAANQKYGAGYSDTQELVTAIHAKFAAQRNNYDSDLQKKSLEDLKKAMQAKLGLLKELAKEQLDMDKAQFEEEMKRQDVVRKGLQKQIDALEKKKKAELAQFDAEDRAKFQGLLAGTSVDDATRREALKMVANPDVVTPTGTASEQLQRRGMAAFFDIKNQDLETEKTDEAISLADYKGRKEKLILLERKFNTEQLSMNTLSEKEKSDLRRRNAELYTEFQQLERQEITATFDVKKELLDAEVTKSQEVTALQQEQIDALTKTYDSRIKLIDDSLKNTNRGLLEWLPSMTEIRNNFEQLVADVVAGSQTVGNAVKGAFGAPSTGGGAGAPSGSSPVKTSTHSVTGGDGKYYATTSEMMAAALPMASGGGGKYPPGLPYNDRGQIVDGQRWFYSNVSQGQRDSYPIAGKQGSYANYGDRKAVEGYTKGTIAGGDGLRLVHDGEAIIPKPLTDMLARVASGGPNMYNSNSSRVNNVYVTGNSFASGVQVEQAVMSALSKSEDSQRFANAGWYSPLN